MTLNGRCLCLALIFASVLAATPPHSSAARSHQPPKFDAAQLNGTWKVTLHETDGVELVFRMTFAVTGKEPLRWEAYTRQGAAREMVGGGTAFLGALLGKTPPHEALIYIGDGTVEERGNAIMLKGAIESPFLRHRDFNGILSGQTIHADLTRSSSGAKAGTMEAVRDNSTEPLRDYAALGAELEGTIRGSIFNPALLQRREFQRFFEELTTRFARARDDLDAVGAFQALKPSLRTSHLELIRNPHLASRTLDDVVSGDKDINPDTLVRLSFPAPEVAFLRVTKWDRVGSAIDHAFERIDLEGSRILILDIRNNPGGDATSMSPVAHLMNQPVTIGAFLGRKWYEAHSAAPTSSELSGIRSVGSDAPPLQLLNDLREQGALVGRVVPRAPYFAGTVYLLVDHATASASEPLMHFLAVARRATVIGERTSGAMLMALPHALRDGWVATIPEADFIAADGTRIEGNGVEPNIKAAPTEVFLAVADQMETTLPYSAAILRAGPYETLKRPAEAERAYLAALRVADQQRPLPKPAWLAWVHKRLAGILKAKGDNEGALREYREVLKLVPDDAEALAAIRGGK
jgi:Peptidase family S41